jgi:hypothetical protein
MAAGADTIRSVQQASAALNDINMRVKMIAA